MGAHYVMIQEQDSAIEADVVRILQVNGYGQQVRGSANWLLARAANIPNDFTLWLRGGTLHEAAGVVAGEIRGIEDRLGSLTPREDQVLGRVILGRLNKQIAADMGISERTVKIHRARVMKKMHAESLAELVRLCERAGR